MNEKFYLTNIFFIKYILILFSFFIISYIGKTYYESYLGKDLINLNANLNEFKDFKYLKYENKSIEYFKILKNLYLNKKSVITSNGDLHKAYIKNDYQFKNYLNFLKKNINSIGYVNVRSFNKNYLSKLYLQIDLETPPKDILNNSNILIVYTFYKKNMTPKIETMDIEINLIKNKYFILFYHLIIYISSSYFLYKSIVILKKKYLDKYFEFLLLLLLTMTFFLIGYTLSLINSSAIISYKILLIFLISVVYKFYPKMAYYILYLFLIFILITLFFLQSQLHSYIYILFEDFFSIIFISYVLSRFFFMKINLLKFYQNYYNYNFF